MDIKIKLDSAQEEKVLKMFEYYYKKAFDSENYPYFSDFGCIVYNSERSPIHWYELTINLLSHHILAENNYWKTVFSTKILQYYHAWKEHPIDFLYDLFIKKINGEPFSVKTEHQYVLELEEKESKKEQRKLDKKNKEKESKKISKSKETINSNPQIISETNKKKKQVSDDDFFK